VRVRKRRGVDMEAERMWTDTGIKGDVEEGVGAAKRVAYTKVGEDMGVWVWV